MVPSFNSNHLEITPYFFFTGKGGVGKTSTACATAIELADKGKKVLLVSTDPASNLQDVLEIELTNVPAPIPEVQNLFACNLDPEVAAKAYRESVIGPYRGKLPDSVLDTMEEQMSGACTVEIAAFDEFTKLLSTPSIVEEYDHIIFDTAPTGHTLRLLQLPTAWSGFLEESTHGASCLGPLSGLSKKKDTYAKTVEVLSDFKQTTLILVARPESSSLQEANRASNELKEIGIKNQLLIINGLLQNFIPNDEVSFAFYNRQQRALQNFPEGLKQIANYSLPYVAYSLTGVSNLRNLFKKFIIQDSDSNYDQETLGKMDGIDAVIDDFSKSNTRVIFTMGKGGVGKTTIASAIAVGLVEKGHRVHLTTTDPAAHLDYFFQDSILNEKLTISRIDPKTEVEKYKHEVITNAEANLDEEGIAYLKEDLESPCTEEIAVFRTLAAVVARSVDEIVVIDTAPTGHTLLLLDASQSYHKELSRTTGDVPDSVKNLIPRLRNEEETAVVVVTLAETTPVLEAERLQEDLRRAHINPKWWVINQSLFATNTKDPVLRGRSSSEEEWIDKVKEKLASHCAIIPWMSEEKQGYNKIKEFIRK